MQSILKRILPYNLKRCIRSFINGHYSYFLWIFPIKNNKIVICNYYGKGYGDNGKYIVEEILNQGLDYDIVWLLKKNLIGKVKFPQRVRTIKYDSLRGLYELATAKVWVDNCRKIFYPPKRKKQFYMQTWHGGIAMKRIEKDVENNLSKGYVDAAKLDSKIANVFISNSKFCTSMYKSVFWYDGDVLESGSPRCDVFFRESDIINDKVRSFYNIDSRTKIVIYAPTFRTDGNIDVYNIDFEKIVEALEIKFGGKWNVLIRLHPNISDKANLIMYSESIINATNYDDMYELLSASDILITDYSSTMFEFSLNYKPVFLYCNDITEYKNDRNFYFDLDELPYKIAEDNNQLFKLIKEFKIEDYRAALTSFYEKVGLKEKGTASAEVVKYISQIRNN